MHFPKIDPADARTFNRKYRRALRVIAYTQLTPKQVFARVSRLVGEPAGRAAKPEHNRVVTAFVGAL